MYIPRETKFRRKAHRPKIREYPKSMQSLEYGNYGIKAMTSGYVSNRQLDTARIAIIRYIRKGGKLWIRAYPHFTLTKKPPETRMGSGKGSPDSHVVNIQPGMILIEIFYPEREQSIRALKVGIQKFSVLCKLIERDKEYEI
jgi:large subunit ribosomal protein L16